MNTIEPNAVKQAVEQIERELHSALNIGSQYVPTTRHDLRLVLARLEELERDKERLEAALAVADEAGLRLNREAGQLAAELASAKAQFEEAVKIGSKESLLGDELATTLTECANQLLMKKAECARLAEQLKAAHEDSKRLDWLASLDGSYMALYILGKARSNTLSREVIDVAMSATPTTQGD